MQIDAVAKSRDGKFRIVSNDEREQTLNQLLTVSIPFYFISILWLFGRREYPTAKLIC
jgi:ATP-dependent Zn protease